MSSKEDEIQKPQSANVLQLGFNISVSGDPGTDFQIVLNDKEQNKRKSTFENELPLAGVLLPITNEQVTKEINNEKSDVNIPLNEITPKQDHHDGEEIGSFQTSNSNDSSQKDFSLMNEIKSTIEHFEKFSDHLKEIPRLKSRPAATSTPFSDKHSFKSETNLIDSDYKPRVKRFAHLYDWQSKKEYFKGTVKPLPPDLFLKPLPAEGYYKKATVTRYFDLEPYRQFGSIDSLNKLESPPSKGRYDNYEPENVAYEPPHGILKKSDSENGDKLSTSSADSVKDIKIYQSGGILIMQNFKDMDVVNKKEISDFSAKLIENCNKLKDEVNANFPCIEEKLIGNSSDESKNVGKMVHFEIPSESENQKLKSQDSSSNIVKEETSSHKMESSESTSDFLKNKDSSTQGTSQSQDFPSLSTQENDSIISTQPGMSPTFFASDKKLEWDSGADVGYLNLDLSKENLSSIERIVLKGLSSDGLSEKKVIYEKKPDQTHTNRSKFILERMPSELVIEEIVEDKQKQENEKKSEKAKEIPNSNDKKTEVEIKQKEILLKDNSKADKKLASEENLNKENNQQTSKNYESPEISKPKRQIIESNDKSVNVDTLFKNSDCQCHAFEAEDYKPAKLNSSGSSPKVKKLRKKKPQKQKKSPSPLKEKIDSIINIARHSSRSNKNIVEMGICKKVYNKIEGNPELQEVELSRDVEEIIIDQRFKIKQNLATTPELEKINQNAENIDSKKETKTKNRPISATSSSNNTVLPNTNNINTKEINPNKFTDKIIQTNNCKTESVGIQAFASQKSSECDKLSQEKFFEPLKIEKGNVNTSSKNIQAFGFNLSLPKQLSHPKEAEVIENQHSKSTQFFGGSINSLPNYHASLLTKPVESCGRMPKVLKMKKNFEVGELGNCIRNEKNIVIKKQVDVKMSERKRDGKKSDNDTENKENLITVTSNNSKKTENHSSNDNKSGSNGGGNSKKNESIEPSVETSTCYQMTCGVASKVLTSEMLRQHGNSIDRNIIQEKYFQSQLIEIEKKEMISKSTSMERHSEIKSKENVTVGCQYSPQSKENSKQEELKDRSSQDTDEGKKIKMQKKTEPSEQYDSSQNLLEEERFGTLKSTNQGQDFATGESLPSSTQTAHSWIPGMQDSEINNKSAVGRARSFEYLPGHIYESSGNLREELPSDIEHNIITCTSSGSSISEAVKNSVSDGQKDSEGRTTLVLENSTEYSYNSDPVKVLDENLTQLNLVVSKLWEKDVQIQSITQSLLVNLWKKNGSGDFSRELGGGDSPNLKPINAENISESSGAEKNCGETPLKKIEKAKIAVENEISIGCQTEQKFSTRDSEKFLEERKALESRITQEKQNQIKWIENEIHHLNILRELLEKQNNSSQKRKKHSPYSLVSNDRFKSEEISKTNVLAEVHPQPVTPVYGLTISVSEKKSPKLYKNCIERKNSTNSEETRNNLCISEGATYGVAVSVSGGSQNLKNRVMLPVGVQVTLADKDFNEKNNEKYKPCISPQQGRPSSTESLEKQFKCRKPKNSQMDMNTQFPSLRRNFENLPSTSAQTDFSYPIRCRTCKHLNCVCLNLSEKSYESVSRSSRNSRKTSEKKESPKLSFANNNEDNKTSNSTDADFLELESYPISKTDQSFEKSGGNRCHSTDSFSKNMATQVTQCKCDNCPKKTVSKVSKPGIVCRDPCKSNIYLNYERSSDEIGSCRCSKVQVQKSSTCSCHIIKIHNSKCCSPENGTCSCKKKILPKKTENQSCQTDGLTVEVKDLVSTSEVEAPTQNPGVIFPSESKIAIESRQSVEEKYWSEPKVSYQKIHPSVALLEVREKNSLERKTPCEEIGIELKTPIPTANCDCRKKENIKVDDHPRHYFLRIEEREIDESNESLEPRKSLEVITVTVPVKKAGKSKIYGNKTYPYSTDSISNHSIKGCNCCEECLNRVCQKISQQCENLANEHFWKNKDKEQKFNKKENQPIPRSGECDSYEDLDNYSELENRPYTSSADCYPEKISAEGIRRNPGYFGKPTKSTFEDYDYSKKNSQESTSTQEQTGYCSHREGKNYKNERKQKESYFQNRRYDCSGRKNGELKAEHLPSRYVPERDQCCPDYYNYNRKEFMTKSELKREQEKKLKIHQPSLQECLESNRPDFYSNAECRRQIISERTKERMRNHNNRFECLMNLIQHCNNIDKARNTGPKRMFTTSQMREQTMKRYRKLPEVTGKLADEKKKEEYKTNKLLADVFAKKLQLEALKGHINLSNSVSVLSIV